MYATNPVYATFFSSLRSDPTTTQAMMDDQTTVTLKKSRTIPKGSQFLLSDFSVLGSSLYSLSAGALRLMLFIHNQIGWNTDEISLPFDPVGLELGMSKRTYSKALNELKDIEVIFKKAQSDYFVNIQVMFRGNRVKFLKTKGYSLDDPF